jgi:hypothetical protein
MDPDQRRAAGIQIAMRSTTASPRTTVFEFRGKPVDPEGPEPGRKIGLGDFSSRSAGELLWFGY